MPETDFAFRSGRDIGAAALQPFLAAVFGEASGKQADGLWWRNSDFAAAKVAIDPANGRIAGLCVGVPSRWELPDGNRDLAAISICGWYVHPDYAGRGLGKVLVRSFDDQADGVNALSISEAAIRNFSRLGWTGPWRSRLRLLPLPRLRAGRAVPGHVVRSARITDGKLPEWLCASLDQIDGGRPANQLRRRRGADEWRRFLAVRSTRRPVFHVMADEAGVPFAYWVIRATDAEAGRTYRMARLHYLSDIVTNRDDPATLRALFAAVARSAPLSAGALLACMTDDTIADAARVSGWLHEGSAMIGPRLAEKAPQYMLGGRFTRFPAKAFYLTFADSDVDLNI